MNLEKTLVIGKLSNNHHFFDKVHFKKNLRMRLSSLNPNTLKWTPPSMISVNKRSIFFNDKIYSYVDFFEELSIKKLSNLIVLTVKEFYYIIDLAVRYKINIEVFEVLYPIKKTIKYYKKLSKNYQQLLDCLTTVEQLGIKGGSAYAWFSNKYRYKIERKLRYKNSLDSIIFFSCFPAYQEVFRLAETRPKKLIYVLDFNSMYGACMEGDFVNPKKLKYIDCKKNNINIDNAPLGFYHVKLSKAKQSPFLQYHPFKYTTYTGSLNVQLKEHDTVEIFLPINEIKIYAQYFTDVEFVQGIYSEENIQHPLKDEITKLYIQKKELANSKIAKLAITALSSVTNPRRYFRKKFFSIKATVQFLEEYFSLTSQDDISPLECINILIKAKLIKLIKETKTYAVFDILNYNSFETIYSIYSTIVSNSRIKMIELIINLHKLKSFELCYANVDSVHFSIDEHEKESLNKIIAPMLSNTMGQLKIESIGNKAYWFDIGRYWIFNNDNKVIKFSNTVFNHLGSNKPFLSKRLIKKITSLGSYKYVKYKNFNIEHAFSYTKKLNVQKNIDNVCFNRYFFNEVESTSVARISKLLEKIHSFAYKKALFEKIATD